MLLLKPMYDALGETQVVMHISGEYYVGLRQRSENLKLDTEARDNRDSLVNVNLTFYRTGTAFQECSTHSIDPNARWV
jgi:hypothetical protein